MIVFGKTVFSKERFFELTEDIPYYQKSYNYAIGKDRHSKKNSTTRRHYGLKIKQILDYSHVNIDFLNINEVPNINLTIKWDVLAIAPTAEQWFDDQISIWKAVRYYKSKTNQRLEYCWFRDIDNKLDNEGNERCHLHVLIKSPIKTLEADLEKLISKATNGRARLQYFKPIYNLGGLCCYLCKASKKYTPKLYLDEYARKGLFGYSKAYFYGTNMTKIWKKIKHDNDKLRRTKASQKQFQKFLETIYKERQK